MEKKKSNVRYSEPTEFIPKNIRKELGIGEFSKENKSAKKVQRKPNQKK